MKFFILIMNILVLIAGCSDEKVTVKEYVYNPKNNLIESYEDEQVIIYAVLKPQILIEERGDNNIILNNPIQTYFEDKLHLEIRITLKDFDIAESDVNKYQDYGNNLNQSISIEFQKNKFSPVYFYQEKSSLSKNSFTYMTVYENLDLNTFFNRTNNLCLNILDYPTLKNDAIQICFYIKEL